MKLKKVTKHPCLKGLLQAVMYQRKDKSRSLRHSKRKALPRYKVQHWALTCRSISLCRAEWLSTTPFHIPAPERPPESTLGGSRQIQSLSRSVQLQRRRRVSQSLPAVTTAPKERGTAVLTSEQELRCRKPTYPIGSLPLPQTQSTLGNRPVLRTPELSMSLSSVS